MRFPLGVCFAGWDPIKLGELDPDQAGRMAADTWLTGTGTATVGVTVVAFTAEATRICRGDTRSPVPSRSRGGGIRRRCRDRAEQANDQGRRRNGSSAPRPEQQSGLV